MIQNELKATAGSDDTLLDLGLMPIANCLYETSAEALDAERYMLRAVQTADKTIHLDVAIPPEILYKDYVYNSGVSQPYKDHCKEMFNSFKHLKHDTIIDIGGNDGTLLKVFKEISKKPLNLINVDASSIFKETNESAGIQFINGFFSDEIDLPKANIITSTNVFQHTKDIHKFLRGIQKCLDGVWILEFPYTLRTLQTLQFDQFYHEHYYYWLITPLESLFKQYGLKIIHAKEIDIHGGSMLLWMTNKIPSAPEGAADKFIKEEFNFNYNSFAECVKAKIIKDKNWLTSLKGKTAFFGAAAKGSVYLNALGLNTLNMPDSYVVDDTPSKQNKFIGGTGFKVVDRNFLYKDQPDNLVVLAHNFGDYIEKSLRPHYKGKVITMFPETTIFSFRG